MRKERVRTKRGFKGFGIFILGWFIGFICTLGMVVGVGYWAYTSITVRRVEKWTKSDITSNEGIEDLTLQKALAIAQGIYSNDDDAYTLNKLEEDFGVALIDDTLYGIDLSLIKNSPIRNLNQAIDDTIDTATFNNVLSFIGVDEDELGLLNTLLNKEMVYYVANGKIYTDEGHNIEAGFKYTVDGNIVKFANGTHTVASGVIRPRLMDMPLYTTLTSITEAAQSLKLHEVMEYHYNESDDKFYQNYDGTNYTNEVSGIMANLAEYTIGELSDKQTFEDIYIYEIMGYTRTGTSPEYVYMDGENEVTGVMKNLAGKTIGDLSNDETFNGLYIYEVMDYHYNIEDRKYYQDYDGTNYTNEVTGVIAHLADAKVNELSSRIDDLTIGKILNVEKESTTGVVKALYDTSVKNIETKLNDLTLGEALGIEEASATGVVKALFNKKVNDLDTEIDNLQIYQIMGYYQNPDDNKYYKTKEGDEYSDQVTGIIGAIAGSKVNEIGDTVDTLKAKDIFDVNTTTILKLFTPAELETLKIMDLPNQVANKINTVSIDYLVANQIITGVDTATEYYQSIKNFTLVQLLNGTGA